MFAIAAIPFDAYQPLTAAEFKVMVALGRYSDRAGRAYPSVRQLARDVLMSPSTTWRRIKDLRERGCFTTERRGRGRFAYTIAEAFRLRWPERVSPKVEHRVSERETQEAYPLKHQEQRVRFAKNRERPSGDDGLTAINWEPRLRSWRRSRFWLPYWGPKPSEAGCWAPEGVIDR